MKITTEELSKNYEEFFQFVDSSDELSIDYDGINDLDPLFALSMMHTRDKDIADRCELTRLLFMNRTVTIKKGEKVLKSFYINAEIKMSFLFKDDPYLLLILCNFSYGLLLKKLIPQSND